MYIKIDNLRILILISLEKGTLKLEMGSLAGYNHATNDKPDNLPECIRLCMKVRIPVYRCIGGLSCK